MAEVIVPLALLKANSWSRPPHLALPVVLATTTRIPGLRRPQGVQQQSVNRQPPFYFQGSCIHCVGHHHPSPRHTNRHHPHGLAAGAL